MCSRKEASVAVRVRVKIARVVTNPTVSCLLNIQFFPWNRFHFQHHRLAIVVVFFLMSYHVYLNRTISSKGQRTAYSLTSTHCLQKTN